VQLVAWIVVCVALSYATRRRPVASLIAILSLWILVPSVAGSLVTGRSTGSFSFHPATWLIFTTLLVQMLENGARMVRVVARHVFLVLALVLVIAVAVLTTKESTSGSGLVLLFDQVVAPVCLFVLVVTTLDAAPHGFVALRSTLIGLAAAESVLTIVQWVANSQIVYVSFYSTHLWFVRVGYNRWMGTLDHPLTLSFFLCVAAPLVVGLSRRWMQVAFLAVATGAVVVTQSRTGIAVILLAILYVITRSRAAATAKLVLYAALSFAVLLLATSAFAAGVAGRFANDTGSTQARGDALRFFFSHWTDYFLSGGGFTSNYQVAQAAGLGSSLESSLLMYAVDIGTVFAVLYFGAQLVIVVRGTGRSALAGLGPAAVVALVIPHTYSALSAGSAVGALLWMVMGMVVASRDVTSPPQVRTFVLPGKPTSAPVPVA
jgi:hypothetical protein